MNDAARFRTLMDIVGDAMERPPEERDAYLVTRCGGDRDLLGEARALVAGEDAVDVLADGIERRVGDAAVDLVTSELREPTTIGSYEIVGRLGHGGMGVVYLARQHEPVRRDVALKVVRQGVAGADTLARFQAESQALARMQHPGIAQVFDAGTTDDGRPYFVMEVVEGLPITDYCEEHALSLDARLELFGAVCLAVHHAHERGVIHRDLKPSNILVVHVDGQATVKVIDFGIAKATLGTLSDGGPDTVDGMPVGTLHYMSPEQIRGLSDGIDERTDVYALGLVLYELVTGVHPFARTMPSNVGWVEAQRVILGETPPRPSSTTSGRHPRADASDPDWTARPPGRIRRELDWIVMKALEKERDRRFPTARDLGRDVERYRRNEPVSAGPPTVAYRARKLARRHRGKVATAALVSMALFAGRLLEPSPEPALDPGSVAVLPFVNLSGDPDQAYFSDGLTEEIRNALGQRPGLSVAARSSSFQFRGGNQDIRAVGRRLGVGAVVEGSVRVDGDALRVTTQLFETEGGQQVWSATFDRRIRDVFAVQEEIARAVASELSVELLPDPMVSTTTADPEAYRHYLRGRHEWRKRTDQGMRAALEAFEQAVALDPGYAAAHAGLADTWQLLPDYGSVASDQALARARTAALRSIALDSTLAEGHVALAALLDDYDRDRAGAEAAYRRAIALNPGYVTARHWLAIHLADDGRFPEALEQIERARRLDPLSDIVNTAVGAVRYFARDYNGAIAEYQAVLDITPDFALAWALLGRAQLVAGRVDDAVASLEHSLRLAADDLSYQAVYAGALAEAGRRDEAARVAERVRAGAPAGYVPYCEVASAYIRLDDVDRAMELFELCFERRDPALKHINVEPLYDTVRGRGDFVQLLRRAGFDVLPAG